jgi:hypothetical protein
MSSDGDVTCQRPPLYGLKVNLPPFLDAEKLGRTQGIGENGIDDLYKVNRPDVDYVVVEYKFGTSKLGDTVDGKQMSDAWLSGATSGRNRILDSVGDRRLAADISSAMDSGRVEKWIVHTDPSGGTSIGVVDGSGK